MPGLCPSLRRTATFALAGAFVATTLVAADKIDAGVDPAYGRNYDLRLALAERPSTAPSGGQTAAAAGLEAAVPGARVEFDGATGATRKLWNPTGYLTAENRAADAADVALGFLAANLELLGLEPGDFEDHEVTDDVRTAATGSAHLYLRQRHAGIPVYNGQLHVNVNRAGRILSVNNQFVPGLARVANTTEPRLSAEEAIAAAGAHLGAEAAVAPRRLALYEGADRRARFLAEGLSLDPIETRLMFLPVGAGARLVWNLQIRTLDDEHYYDMTVDALDGRVWTRIDWVADDDYKVYPPPIESPLNAIPPPPGDGRVIETNPADATASPFGWHDTNGAAGAEYTWTRGNNVHAWEDSDGNNSEPPAPPAGETDCGVSLSCVFPLDLNLEPSANRPAAVANLFYWNNLIHDTQYLYGFDEAGGNFQDNLYGNPGAGNDHVRALAQSGAGTCNANFLTQPDGTPGRMRMYICDHDASGATPNRDGDLDNLVIVHEYGHGISNRLVGGPADTSCLGNTQQPGEGLSDWWGLAYTHEPGDQGTDVRPVGLYLIGAGIRPQPYSTDQSVNTYTYETIGTGVSVPHGVGSVWAQAAWEVYWALVGEHGFSSDLYDAGGSAGNNRALLYLVEGLKNSACSPTFLDVRDGVIQAAVDNYGGEDVCLMWEAFAAFGLGENATTVGPSSLTATNGFDVPVACSFGSAGDDARICAGSPHVQDILVGPAFTSPPVDMFVVNNPPGTTALFSENPVSGPLPEVITLTIGNTGAVPAGTYTITVTADDGVDSNNDDFDLTVDAAIAAAPTPTSPADGAVGTARKPTLEWTAVAAAATYTVDVATDAGFANVVFTASDLGANSVAVTTNLAPGTLHFWRVYSHNACGTSAASASFSFTTGVPSVLLVDDDDDGPDVSGRYQTMLNGAGLVFDEWDVAALAAEPSREDMSGYDAVVWFSGDRFCSATSPCAGPQSAAETALGQYLDNGACLLVSSQDYLWDMGTATHDVPTPFMIDHLGVASPDAGASDAGDYTSVAGENVYAGLASPLTYTGLFSDFSDELIAGAGQTVAFRGNNSKVGGLSKAAPAYFTTYLAFALEAMNEADRIATLQRFIDTCNGFGFLFADNFEDATFCDWSDDSAGSCAP